MDTPKGSRHAYRGRTGHIVRSNRKRDDELLMPNQFLLCYNVSFGLSQGENVRPSNASIDIVLLAISISVKNVCRT